MLALDRLGSGAGLLTPEYMKALFEPGRPLDASRYYLIFPDNVGHGKSSKPSDGLKAGFPNYGYGDIVDLQHKLVTETLGIKRLHAIVGCLDGRHERVAVGGGLSRRDGRHHAGGRLA